MNAEELYMYMYVLNLLHFPLLFPAPINISYSCSYLNVVSKCYFLLSWKGFKKKIARYKWHAWLQEILEIK